MATETSVLNTLDTRLAKIEGALPYLASKEDISDLRGEIGEIRGEIKSLRWSITWSMSLLGVILSVLMFVLR
ncbi:MAG: hypothetical protein OXB89_08095 [Anaerolineaceae bacterium]|nr:hypothetical protein [Anaerolineaceae bacterium]